ncbi:MAG: hypothetical protein JXA99_14450 [Candidatus Lokiarchaeota archaeon]|nr:hypothetical protein [Candidatus Lokiarchaeota archaeon]
MTKRYIKIYKYVRPIVASMGLLMVLELYFMTKETDNFGYIVMFIITFIIFIVSATIGIICEFLSIAHGRT